MSEKTMTLEKIYKKIGKLEQEIEELKYAVKPLKSARKASSGIKTFVASEKTLKKDWGFKGDDVWDEL